MARLTRCLKRSQPKMTTQSGAIVAKKVALAIVVRMMERCQKNRSPVKAMPARMVGRVKLARAAFGSAASA